MHEEATGKKNALRMIANRKSISGPPAFSRGDNEKNGKSAEQGREGVSEEKEAFFLWARVPFFWRKGARVFGNLDPAPMEKPRKKSKKCASFCSEFGGKQDLFFFLRLMENRESLGDNEWGSCDYVERKCFCSLRTYAKKRHTDAHVVLNARLFSVCLVPYKEASDLGSGSMNIYLSRAKKFFFPRFP